MSKLKDVVPNKTPTHMVRPAALELQKKTKETLGKYVEREKLAGEVKAPEMNIWDRTTYRTGDGDYTAQVPRAGSMDAYKLPSRGNRT